MDFHFTPEQEQFRDAVRGFADRHLRDGALKRAHQEEHPWDVAKLMAEQGLMGITMKEEEPKSPTAPRIHAWHTRRRIHACP